MPTRLVLISLLLAACGSSPHVAEVPPANPVDAGVTPDAPPAAAAPAADAGPQAPGGAATRAFVRAIPDDKTWATYSRTLGSDTFGKYVIDLRSGEIYFFDVNLFRMHTDFVFQVIYRKPVSNDALIEFVKNYDADKPRFILGYLTHHLKVDEWTMSFWEGDTIRPADIRRARKKLLATFFMGAKLKWRPDSPMQEQKLAELKDIPTITNDKIYKEASYQAFNNGTSTGTLRIVPPTAKYEDLVFNRDDIVILQESYPDITPVSGIVSTVFSTPLSHVNLRAKTWNIPNAGIKDAAQKHAGLNGKVVVLEVRDVDYLLREATPKEVKAWQAKQQATRTVRIPQADLKTRELRHLNAIRAKDTKIYGAKTANLGEIVSRNPGVNVPDGFGIPFSYYQQHLKAAGIDKQIQATLADPRWGKDAAFRKASAEKLRDAIRAAPIDAKLLDALWGKVQKELGGKGVFVRSSTNAEDLEGFNGAGLYDTVPNVKDKQALGDAVKQVWGSVWNFTAVEERALFGIDHRYVYAGVLVQIGVNASAAGVLITKNLYDPDDPNSYTINAKRGLGLRVVGGTTVPEQVIFDTSNYGTKIISRSDDPTMLVFDEKSGGVKEMPNPNKETILSEYRAYALAMACKKIIPLFSAKYPLDIEWVLVGDEVWIVQARPYMAH
jgi:Pyruvate phosphate dikinase, AMP/ATP-binding domain